MDPSNYPQLMELINATYRDRVESIVAAQIEENGDILAVALDGRKRLAVKITDSDIQIKLMGGEVAANNLKFAASGPKKKTCAKGISCRNTCISPTKTCRVDLTPSQKAQKEKISKQKAKKVEPESKPKATKTALERVREANPELKDYDAKLKASTVDKLEARLANKANDADTAYRDALLAKEDIHSSEAALDRISNLFGARNELEKNGELSPDRLRDIPSDFGQGLRGGKVQAATNAAAEYTAEIWGKLPPQQQDKFVEYWMDYARDRTISEQAGGITGFGNTLKSKRVKEFVEAVDKRIRQLNGEE